MEKQVVATAKAPGAIGPYSQGIKVGNLVFVSGCLPIDMATGQLSTGDIAEQTRHSLRNVTAILEAAGSSLDKVVKTTIFVKDLKNFQTINAHMRSSSRRTHPHAPACRWRRYRKTQNWKSKRLRFADARRKEKNMLTFEEKLAKYAELLIGLGVNLQKGQYLLLDIDAENYPLARALSHEAFQRGAKDVIIHWAEPYVDRERALSDTQEDFSAVAPWETESYAAYIQQGACSLRILPAYPTLFEGADPQRVANVQQHGNNTRNILRKGTAENGMHWCISTAPSENWAKFLFPALNVSDGVAKLWDVLFNVCRIDENAPIRNWLDAMGENGQFADILNREDIDSIHYTNGIGTDITVGFQPGVLWVGAMGGDYTPDMYLPNIPTAEVSTSPDKFRVNGTVKASRPLMLNGTVVDGFGFTFRDGQVVDFYAEKGYDALKSLLDTDEGSRYLGEVAFVQCDSPLAKTGLLFMETLLDENAACHMALGRGFNILFKGLSGTDFAAWDRVNLNHSRVHVDFMFGTDDLRAEVTLRDGRKGVVFVNGKFNADVQFA